MRKSVVAVLAVALSGTGPPAAADCPAPELFVAGDAEPGGTITVRGTRFLECRDTVGGCTLRRTSRPLSARLALTRELESHRVVEVGAGS